MQNRTFFKKTDLVVLLILMILGLWTYSVVNKFAVNKGAILYAEINYDGEIAIRVSLENDMVFSLDEAPGVVFQIKNNSIGFMESDCPDKICVNTGMLKHAGQSAACLPNKISVTIIGGLPPEVDVIAK